MKLSNKESKIKLLAIMLITTLTQFLQGQNIIDNGNMESSSGWTVYNMGSANPASYEFNYTIDGPTDGSGGCLRVTSDKATNILFWQKLDLKAGKSYVVDGAVKTGFVASFWCEVYMSLVAPVEGQDYSPNNNEDREWIISTWMGCGPNLDGKFSAVSCGGDGIYVPPGVYDENVEVYFGIKTGIWNDMDMIEVLLDEFTLQLVQDWYLIDTDYGILNQDSLEITNIPPLITVDEFKSGLRAPYTATIEIIGMNSGVAIPDQESTLISDTMLIEVTGNEIAYYDIEVRPVGTGNNIIEALTGTVDTINAEVTNLPVNAKVIQLKTSINVSPYATYSLLDASGQKPPNHVLISSDMYILITAENGDEKTYTIELGTDSISTEYINDSTAIMSIVKNKILDIEGNTEWHITRDHNPLPGSIINLESEECWFYFDSIKPSDFYNSYIDQILVNGSAPVIDQNIRLVRYYQGCVLIGHDADYVPLTVYDEEYLGGNSMEFEIYNYYKSDELGAMNNAIKSFRLKKGYMATLARYEDGTGYSRVYIANEDDITIDSLPEGIYGTVSYVRVIPWRWTTKKGFCGSSDGVAALNGTWHYDWNNEAQSDLDIEYIPMRHNAGWNAYTNINYKKNTTHVLAFNEPDRPDQADMSVQEAIDQWPQLLRSGLRLGSPAPSDGGLSWLYTFIDRCDQLNYRVDFVAVHWYQGGQSAQSYYNWLKNVHDRTKRPIWITEWNNGANWTCCEPTYQEQAQKIGEFLYMLDTTSFVERYSLYEWLLPTHKMFYEWATTLTPAGKVYKEKVSPAAFNRDKEYYQDFVHGVPAKASNPSPETGKSQVALDTILSWIPGEFALQHGVYLGDGSNPAYKGTQNDTFYIAEQLEPITTYYWRIDEVNGGTVIRGNLWSFTTLWVDDINAIDEEEDLVKVYPVPVADIVQIRGLRKTETVEIFNSNGTKVLTRSTSGSLDISHLDAGLYILKIAGYKPMRIIKNNE